MGVKIADKLEQFNNGTYYLVDSSAVEYVDKDGNAKSVKDVLDNTDELSKEDVERLLGLTKEENEAMSDLILDTEVRLDKTYSSSKIYSSIQDAIDTSKAYTLSELGKMSGASYKVVTATNEMTDEKIIYLLDNGTTFDMYIVESGIPTKIGDTNIDLSEYYTKTEVDNDFLKKTHAASTYATKTELNEKANDDEVAKKADITYLENRVTTNEANITDLQEQTSDLQKQIDNLDISDTTDLTNVRKVFYGINELNNAKGTNISLVVGEDNTMKIVDALSPIETFADYFHNNINGSRFGIDANTYGTEISLLTITKFNDNVATIRAFMLNGKLLVRRYFNGVLQDWSYDKGNSSELTDINTKLIQLENTVNQVVKKDVPNTVIVSENTSVELNSKCYYTVINGVCYVSLWGFTCTEAGQYVVNSSMPKTKLTMQGLCTYGSSGYEGGCAFVRYDGNGNNKLYVEAKATNEPLYGSFSYPVAE